MQLLVERSQTASTVTLLGEQTNFNLWAKCDLTPEEDSLVANYTINKTILTIEKPGQFKKAAIWGGVLAFIAAFILDQAVPIVSRSPLLALIILVVLFPLYTVLIYFVIRKYVKVSDLLAGHTFHCNSVIDLILQEKKVREWSLDFRYLLESLKNWRTREIVNLE